jgi:RNA polymerase sigma factor (sigma-70 family)
MQKRFYDQWPGPDDAPVIDAMLNDTSSHHWNKCQTYVNELVLRLARDFSSDDKEEIVQNSMFWIVRYLPYFERKCRLTTWIVRVVHTRIADAGRLRQTTIRRQALPTNELDEDKENKEYISKISSPRTVEEECILREDLRESSEALLEYLSTHSNSERNILILEMHIAGFSQEDIAKKLHMPTPNVGYVIRSAQSFLREQKWH